MTPSGCRWTPPSPARCCRTAPGSSARRSAAIMAGDDDPLARLLERRRSLPGRGLRLAARDGFTPSIALTPGLVRVGDGDARAVAAAVGADADTFLVLTGLHARTGWKYMERGYRHVWWDAGTMLANLIALAVGGRPRAAPVHGLRRRELNRLLGADGAQRVLACGDRTRGGGGVSYPLAEAAQADPRSTSSICSGVALVVDRLRGTVLPRRGAVAAIRRRSSVRRYGTDPLPARRGRGLARPGRRRRSPRTRPPS